MQKASLSLTSGNDRTNLFVSTEAPARAASSGFVFSWARPKPLAGRHEGPAGLGPAWLMALSRACTSLLVQHALETLCWNEGVEALGVPTGSKFEVSTDIRHMWGIVPQVKGMEEGLDGHHIHPGLVAQ